MLIPSYLTQLLRLSLLSVLIAGCSTTKGLGNQNLEVEFLDEYTLPAGFKVKGETFGGISGVDFRTGKLIMTNDSPSNPLLFSAEFNLNGYTLDTLVFTSVLKLEGDAFFEENALDMESVRFDGLDYLISTEGNIDKDLPPRIFKLSQNAEFIEQYPLPDYFLPNGTNQPRHNGVFEGLSMSSNSSGFWFANELPLEEDATTPKLYNTNSPVRISYYDRNQNQITRQYAMDLDRITKIPLLPFALNGLTELLQLDENRFLVLERSYSAGHKSHGNRVKLFLVDISKATDIKGIEELSTASENIVYAKKSLLFDFKSIASKLTHKIVDNLEGICFGPILPNGNITLIVTSDDNFNNFGPQLNQFILLELKSN
ncbi:esterase-like activity of phytase family protein [Psychroflexus sp. YR1-1]|uniref:Esterase-like activity of phytase family protein n=1 Tax=Psychroflexus aurantiacus TaxID=2709310 RepID=A0A6B3R2Z6_9FLAO|nr:esterase-like activity of phytase family protein [Psychroflexus aurantiacus]NEV93135.1 esterase-like activity of phytase family protein [Psychroflexus aurantiacus]